MSTFPLLELGQQVGTPQGAAEVVSIALVGGTYHEGQHRELEPPIVTVRLLDSGEEVQVCLCKLELDDQEAQTFLRSEFDRLWPPVPEVVELSASFRKVLNQSKIKTVPQLLSFLKTAAPAKLDARMIVESCFTSLIVREPSHKAEFEKEEKIILAALDKGYHED